MSEAEASGAGDVGNTQVDANISRLRPADADEGTEAVPAKSQKLEEHITEDGKNENVEEDFDEDDEDDNNAEDVEFADENEDIEIGDLEEGQEENDLEEVGESSDIDDYIQGNLSDIEECQTDIETLNKKANDEILKVEQKYNKLRQPVYVRRSTYINKIPNFWGTVFSRHPQLKRVLSIDDVKCLKHLVNLQIDDFEDSRSGYRIKFSFSKNPWFTNSLITKEYHLPWNDSPSCECTLIDWLPGMNLTEKQSSFFSWFCSQDDASTDDIAEIIKEELWPNPLQVYLMKTNGQVESEDSEEDDEGPVYIDDDDEEEEDEEEAEYISSEGEEEWKNYRPQRAYGKEAPTSSATRNYNEEDVEYGGELDDDDDDQYGDDVPDGLDDDEASKQSNDDVTEVTEHVTKGVTSSGDIQSTEISQTDPELATTQQKDDSNDVIAPVES